MKKDEIQVGCIYLAKVSGKLTRVKVNEIWETDPAPCLHMRSVTRYTCTNLATGRPITIKSAGKFRSKSVFTEQEARDLHQVQNERAKEIAKEIEAGNYKVPGLETYDDLGRARIKQLQRDADTFAGGIAKLP